MVVSVVQDVKVGKFVSVTKIVNAEKNAMVCFKVLNNDILFCNNLFLTDPELVSTCVHCEKKEEIREKSSRERKTKE
jgi:hypothetical protein